MTRKGEASSCTRLCEDMQTTSGLPANLSDRLTSDNGAKIRGATPKVSVKRDTPATESKYEASRRSEISLMAIE